MCYCHVDLLHSPYTKQETAGSFELALMNKPEFGRQSPNVMFLLANGRVQGLEVSPKTDSTCIGFYGLVTAVAYDVNNRFFCASVSVQNAHDGTSTNIHRVQRVTGSICVCKDTEVQDSEDDRAVSLRPVEGYG